MINKKGLLRIIALLVALLVLFAVAVILLQYKQADYIFRGKTVAATITDASTFKDKKEVKVIYISEDGEDVEATAVLKNAADEGDIIYLLVTNNHTDKLYQIPSRAGLIAFDIAFLFFEFLGWTAAIKLVGKLKKYRKLEAKGKRAEAVITKLQNTSGVLEADIQFTDDMGVLRKTVYCPLSNIPSVDDKMEIIYYIKRTGKVVYIVPEDEK